MDNSAHKYAPPFHTVMYACPMPPGGTENPITYLPYTMPDRNAEILQRLDKIIELLTKKPKRKKK